MQGGKMHEALARRREANATQEGGRPQEGVSFCGKPITRYWTLRRPHPGGEYPRWGLDIARRREAQS